MFLQLFHPHKLLSKALRFPLRKNIKNVFHREKRLVIGENRPLLLEHESILIANFNNLFSVTYKTDKWKRVAHEKHHTDYISNKKIFKKPQRKNDSALMLRLISMRTN